MLLHGIRSIADIFELNDFVACSTSLDADPLKSGEKNLSIKQNQLYIKNA